MEKIKATAITKRIKKAFFSPNKYMLGLSFHDIYNIDTNENTKEMRVSYLIYESTKVGDTILCPMKREDRGLTFDFSQPIESIKK
jgi:galactose-1-phosphate uridylyltransferase